MGLWSCHRMGVGGSRDERKTRNSTVFDLNTVQTLWPDCPGWRSALLQTKGSSSFNTSSLSEVSNDQAFHFENHVGITKPGLNNQDWNTWTWGRCFFDSWILLVRVDVGTRQEKQWDMGLHDVRLCTPFRFSAGQVSGILVWCCAGLSVLCCYSRDMSVHSLRAKFKSTEKTMDHVYYRMETKEGRNYYQLEEFYFNNKE